MANNNAKTIERNIFSPNMQKPLVKAIAEHYGLSSRHTSALTADPPLSLESEHEPRPANQSRVGRMRASLHRNRDPENGGYSGSFGEPAVRGDENLKRGKGGYMDLVSNVWHWHAVEWGGRCKLYFGFAIIQDLHLFFWPLTLPYLILHRFLGIYQ